MKEEKPKAIKTIGIVVAALSALTIISSVLGLTMANHLTEGTYMIEGIPNNEQPLAHVKSMAILSIVISLCFLVAGIFIIRYRNWARVLAQVVAALYLIIFWYLAIFIAPNNPFDKGKFGIEQTIGPLLWSIPVILLIRYLNRENVKNHFV